MTGRKLGDVADFYGGSSLPEGEEFSDQPGGFLLLRVSDLNLPHNSTYVNTGSHWTATHGSKSATAPKNSLVIPKRGGAIGTNKKRILARDCILDPNLMAIHPHGEELDVKFLYHWFRTFDLLDITSGSAVPQLNKQDLRPLSLPLPRIDEQRRIASLLDQADELRAKRIRAISLLDELTQSIFLDMFGSSFEDMRGQWPMRTLGSLSTAFSDGPFGSNLKSSHYRDSGIRVIRLQNIGVGRFIDNDAAFISEEHFARLGKHRCLPGDVIIGTLGDPNLRAIVQPPEVDVALNKADCVQMRVDPAKATAAYVSALLNQPIVERMAKSLMHGQTRTRISMGQLREMEVPVPPLQLQHKFGIRSELLSNQRSRQVDSLTELDALFSSLQAKAFSGKL